MKGQVSFPMGRWFAGMLLIITIYYVYGIFSPIIDDTFPTMVEELNLSPYITDIVADIGTNFWVGIIILFGGVLFWMFIAGIPGQQEERIV